MKKGEEAMEILEAYDATGSFRAAAGGHRSRAGTVAKPWQGACPGPFRGVMPFQISDRPLDSRRDDAEARGDMCRFLHISSTAPQETPFPWQTTCATGIL